MANAIGTLGDLVRRPPAPRKLARGENVELHLDTGDVIHATVTSLRSRSASTDKVTARARTWSRWKGTPSDLIGLVRRASQEIAQRSSESPAVNIRVSFSDSSDADEERYFDAGTAETVLRFAQASPWSAAAGRAGACQ